MATSTLPQGSLRSVDDPFAEKRVPWKTYAFLVLLLFAITGLWQQGYLSKWLGQYVAKLNHTEAPP